MDGNFVFPIAKHSRRSPISVPVNLDGKCLEFGLVEVGCSPGGKRKQLLDGQDLLEQVWQGQLPGLPQIYRFMVHYRPERDWESLRLEVNPDLVAIYRHISSETLGTLTRYEKGRILTATSSNKRHRQIKRILRESDADGLHRIIVDERDNPEVANLRGTMGEVMALRDIARLVPDGMKLLKNGSLMYFNGHEHLQREVDGILTAYGKQPYIDLAVSLGKLPNLEVKQRLY